MHGGKSPKGADSANFKDGRHSKYLPAKLASIYENIEQDLEANILSRNLKLREALIRQKLEMLEDAPDSQEAWNKLRVLFDDLKKGFINEDYGKVSMAIEMINRVIDERILYHMAASEIRKDLNEQRNDTTAKAAITLKGESAVSVNELMAFIGAFFGAISAIVTREELIKIHDATQHLISAQSSNQRQLVTVESESD
jgi:uncharacterized protein YjcR